MEKQNVLIAARLIGQTISDIARLDTNRNGTLEGTEIFAGVSSVATRLLMTLPGIDFKELWPELREKDTDARQLLVVEFADAFELANEKLEAVIEDTINLLADVIEDVEDYTNRVRRLVADIQEVRVASEG